MGAGGMNQMTLLESIEPITEGKKHNQRDIILQMLYGKPCHCGEFMRKGIAQYNARIKELRQQGYLIEYNSRFKVFRMVRKNETNKSQH